MLLLKSVFVGSLGSVPMVTNLEGRLHLTERRAKAKWKTRDRLCGEGREDPGLAAETQDGRESSGEQGPLRARPREEAMGVTGPASRTG